MSRFVNAEATRTVDLGPCECPGTPHENDWAKLRDQLSGTELAALSNAQYDEFAAARVVAPLIPEWNLLGSDGDEMPVSAAALAQLTAASLTPISAAIAEIMTASARLPNAPSAPSPASPRGSASPTRTKTRTPGT